MKVSLRIWKFPLMQMLVEISAIFIATLVSVGVMTLPLRNVPIGLPARFCGVIAILAIIVFSWKAMVHFIEGKSDPLYPAKGAVTELFLGIFLGFLIVTGMCLLAWWARVLSITGVQGFGDFWMVAVLAVVPATLEELAFRGIILRHLERMLGTWAALVISSVLFGAVHLANPNSSLLDAAAITLEAGILLGAAYLCTRRLWLATGIHAAWNFTLGWIFSLPVSGYAAHGLLATQLTGSAFRTGAGFGLEGSIFSLAVGTPAGIFLVVVAMKRQKKML